MTIYVNVCSGTTPGGEQPQMMRLHGEKVEERMLIVMTVVSMTSAVSVVSSVVSGAMTGAMTAVTETVGMTVNPELQPEVRRKVSRTCQKNINVVTLSTYKSQLDRQHYWYQNSGETPLKLESAGGAMCSYHRALDRYQTSET